MIRFTLTHEIPCDEATFWETFFDREYNLALYLKELGFPSFEIVDQRETDAAIVRRAVGQPKVDFPGPIAKLIGPNLRYTEDGTFDKKTRIFRWTMKPSTLADKMKNGGELHVEPAGPGSVRRVVEAYAEASVFGLGGLLESTTEKQVRDGWEKSGAFMKRWVLGARGSLT